MRAVVSSIFNFYVQLLTFFCKLLKYKLLVSVILHKKHFYLPEQKTL
jgi:hypothetical protein